jgi:hypothetical protein
MSRRVYTIRFLALFITLFSASAVMSQSIDYGWYFNANFGVTQPFCDLQEENNHISKLQDETDLGYGLKLAKYLSPVFAIHAQFLKAKLTGSKLKSDASFETDFMEYQLGTTINLSTIFFGKKPDRSVWIYGTTGIGTVMFRGESYRLSDPDQIIDAFGYDDITSLKKDKREPSWIFPVGLGGNIKFSNRWYLNLETVLRLMTSDKLDIRDVGPRNDAFFYTSMGLTYNFGGGKDKEFPIKDPEEVLADIPSAIELENPPVIEYHLPEEISSLSEFDLSFTLHKYDIDGMAELMQILPIGFTVTDTVVEGAENFKYKNYTVNMVWEELPPDSSITITYHVNVGDIYGNLPINSILYVDKASKEFEFKTSIYVSKPLSDVDIDLPEEDTIAEVAVDVPEIEFKVQVRAAYKAKISLQRLAEKYNITDSIREDFVGNWYRYSIGSFKTYNEAKEYRKIVVSQNKVYDAFVVAFRNGVRLNSLSELKELPESSTTTTAPPNTSYSEEGRVYRVQILALLKNRVTVEDLADIYNLTDEIREEYYDPWRKYTMGGFTDFDDAVKYRDQLRKNGISDAFIVIYDNGVRLSVE